MADGFEDLDRYNAPQWFEFGSEEASNVDTFFNSRLELRSKSEKTSSIDNSNAIISAGPSIVVTEATLQGGQECKRPFTPRNLALDELKNSYRAPIVRTPLSGACSAASTPMSRDSPGLEYTRPWLDETSGGLACAMAKLRIREARCSRRLSVTPDVRPRTSPLQILTSTPCITADQKTKPNFAGRMMQHPCNFDCEDIPEIAEGEHTTERSDIVRINSEIERINHHNQKTSRTETSDNCPEPILTIDPQSEDEILTFPTNPNEPTSSNDHESDATEFPVHFANLKKHSKSNSRNLESSKVISGNKKTTAKPRVLTSQVRRQSLKYRRRSGKYVSMAEAILKFQRDTPKRFRTNSTKPTKPGAAETRRKTTCPASPNLRSKSRVRSATLTNNRNAEASSMKETRRIRVKTTVQSKPVEIDVPSTLVVQNVSCRPASTRRTVTMVQSTGQGPELKKIGVFNCGVPATGTRRKVTRPVPFKFSSIPESSGAQVATRGTSSTTSTATTTKTRTAAPTTSDGGKTTSAVLMTFEERNNLLLKKRKDFAKTMIEHENRARTFHARPAPTFKPVKVSRTQTESSKIERDRSGRAAAPVATARSPLGVANGENIAANSSKLSHCPRATEERLLKRHDFDAKMQKKSEEEEARVAKENAERLSSLEKDVTKLRKTMEPKANPMPNFKPLKIAKSKKPLTIPQSPAWSRRTKNKENEN